MLDYIFHSLTEYHPLMKYNFVSGDIFIVHGTDDDDIPVDYCFLYQRIFWQRSDGQCDKEVISDADHIFSSHQSQQQLFSLTCNWLDERSRRQENWSNWII
ncbi:prolyl oligopeptidase family serine peptidase [Aneurinibacillus terranovensis]|uniref:prolyl oligopeptidase family serine peptidase n=1 Tax=Aneurinibacillus terranovensis TaxID=278991 RepID=UPI0012DEAA9A|nr:prolyl oligopeptidase family serine peptidase [Aneurinibacillus terranovensis]